MYEIHVLLLLTSVSISNFSLQTIVSLSHKFQSDKNTEMAASSKRQLHIVEVNNLETHSDIKDVNPQNKTGCDKMRQKNSKDASVPVLCGPIKSSETLQSDDHVVIKKKTLQIQKAAKLELCAFLAPDVTPLNSPIPACVQRAFKPPSRSPNTPASSGVTAASTERTPITTRGTPIYVCSTSNIDQHTPLSSRSVVSLKMCRSVPGRRLGTSRTVTGHTDNDAPPTISAIPATAADTTVPMQRETIDNDRISDNNNDEQLTDVEKIGENNDELIRDCEAPVNNTENINLTYTGKCTGKRKRNVSGSSELKEVAQQRRRSLRLRKI